MTIREFYEEIGEDYDEMLNRFTSEERVKKYALMFLKDDTFPSLVTSMESKDYETAFRNVHTLKGVSSNLGYMKLYQAAVILTDILRTKNYDVDLETPFNNIKDEYYKVLSALKRFANQ